MTIDSSGNLFVVYGESVVKVDPTGAVTTVAGYESIIADDNSDNWVPGPATAYPVVDVGGIAVDKLGNLFLTSNDILAKVTPAGVLSRIACDRHLCSFLQGIASDPLGNVYIGAGQRMIRMDQSGNVSVVAGSGNNGSPVPGPATSSPLNGVTDVVVAPDGSLYAIVPGVNNNGGWIVHVSNAGELSIVAGNGSSGKPIAGPALGSPFGYMNEIAMDASGNLYVTDGPASMILKVSVSGELSVVAGSGVSGSPVEGPATNSPLGWPGGIAIDGAGNIYFTDEGYPDVYRITSDGTLHRLS